MSLKAVYIDQQKSSVLVLDSYVCTGRRFPFEIAETQPLVRSQRALPL